MIKGLKIKAFTIMEITVAMLISAIVIAITYTCFFIIQRSYITFNEKQKKIAEVSALNKVMSVDIDKGDMLIRTDSGFLIKNKIHEIKYNVENDYVVRATAVTDTFKLHSGDLTCYFEGSIVESSSNQEMGRIDEINFTVFIDTLKISYTYDKRYSSQQLIKRNFNAYN